MGNRLSGIDAVKKIVETEAQARRIVEEAKTKAQDIVNRASKDADMARQGILAQAQTQRNDILSKAKVDAEAEAGRSDVETEQVLTNYQKMFENKKSEAVEKAVQLVLRG